MAQENGYRLSLPQAQTWGSAGADPVAARVTLVARVDQPLRAEPLREACARVVARHAILRTTCGAAGAARQPLQMIGDASVLDVDPPESVPGGTRLRLSLPALNGDAETLRLVLRDLLDIYAAGGAREEGPEPLPYVNVSEWQHELARHPDSAEMLDWWRQKADAVASAAAALPGRGTVLRTESAPPGFTADATRSAPSPAISLAFRCDSDQSRALASLASSRQISRAAVVLAAWQVSQGWFARALTLPHACRFDGRFSPELEGAVGAMSRYLPILVRCRSGQSFAEAARAAHDALDAAAERQEYWHPAIAERDDPLPTLSAFSCVDRPRALRMGGMHVTIEAEEEPAPSVCPAVLQCVWDEDGLSGRLHTHAAESGAMTASRLDAFLACLASGVTHPDGAIRGMPLVSGAVEAQLIAAASPTAAEAASLFDATAGAEVTLDLLPALVAAVVDREPHRLAAICGERRLTYGELGAHAGRLREELARAGAGAETPVGLLMPASAEALVAMMATLWAGAIYVPLGPDDPPARLAQLIAALDIRIVLTRADESGSLANANATVRAIRVDLDTPVSGGARVPVAPCHPEQAAYAIHTSGSTGEARAVLVSHRTLLRSTRARRAFYRTPVGRYLLVSPLTFDSSIAGLFWTLADGGALIFPGTGGLQPDELRGLVARHGATHLLCIPRMLQAIADQAAAPELDSLRTVIVAGEACPRSIASSFAAAAPRAALYNEYGVTEAGVWSTVHRVSAEEPEPTVPIGEAVPGVRAYVCASDLQLAPIESAGELCIGGDFVARAYCGRPGASAARFVPDPYAAVPGGRLYRTGDLVRRASDGTLRYLGRADQQVKVRGQRIELEQVEAIMRETLPLADAAVVLTRGAAADALVAYYTARPEHPVTSADVHEALAARLPPALAPAHVFEIDALPQTSTGKIDRPRLAAMPLPLAVAERSEAPRGAIEETLAAVWAEVLGLPAVGRDQDFFSLGGDSIVGLQIASRARRMGLAVTPRQVLTARTIAALAAALSEAEPDAVRADGATGRLTPIQQWFFAEGFAEPHHYNQAVLLEAETAVDATALTRALAAIAAVHPALRTAFVHDGQAWRAELRADAAPIEPRPIDARELDAAAAQASFDLGAPPLLRVWLLRDRAGASRDQLLVIAHHLIVDGVSWRILLDDLATAYGAARRGERPDLPEELASVDAWAGALDRRIGDAGARDRVRAWLGPVSHPAEAALPFDHPGGMNRESSADTVSFRLTPERTAALRHLADGRGEDALLLTALGRSLAEWCGRDAIWIAVERHGRDLADVPLDPSRTVGWFTTIVPLRLRCDRTLSMPALFADVQAQLRAVPDDAWICHALRAAGADEEAELAAWETPLVGFNNLGRLRAGAASVSLPFTLAGEPPGPLRSPRAHRPHVIDVTALTVGDELRVTVTYSAALHERATIARLGERMRETLDELCRAVAV